MISTDELSSSVINHHHSEQEEEDDDDDALVGYQEHWKQIWGI